MEGDDDFRIIEEHDVDKQNASADDSSVSPPSQEKRVGSFDTEKKPAVRQQAPSPAPDKSAEQVPPPSPAQNTDNENAPGGDVVLPSHPRPPQPAPQKQEKKTRPSDSHTSKDSGYFSKPIFPKEQEEEISPEGVVMKHRDKKKERTPSFEQTRKDFSRSDILLEEQPTTPVRDPLFAAHVLSEQGRDETQEHTRREPERPIPVPGMRGKTDSGSPEGPRGLSIVRTYESDIAQALKKGQTSLSRMVMAEGEKQAQQKSQHSKQRIRTWGFLGGTFLLLVAAGAVIGGSLFYQTLTQAPPQETDTAGSALFLVENTVTINTSSGNLLQSVRGAFSDLAGDLDSITRLRIVESRTVGEEERTQDIPLTAEEFFTASSLGAPEPLRRSLLEEFLLGAYSFDGTQPFLVLKTDSFENAFSGMLQWEESGFAEDMAALFGINADAASGTSFADVILKNRDLRAVRDQDGSLFLFYTFVDQETLVIATRESTLNEVVQRINRSR